MPVVLSITLATRYGKFTPGSMRSRRSGQPWSNSWLPTDEAVTSSTFSSSMVGSSFWANDVNNVAPTLSPADTSSVLSSPAAARCSSMVPTQAAVLGLEFASRP